MINLPKFFLNKSKKTQKVKIPSVVPALGFEKIKELIAPPGAIFELDYFQIGSTYGKTFFILEYPSFLFSGWLEKIITLDETFNISLYFYPLETTVALSQLKSQLKKIGAQIEEIRSRTFVRSPELETAYRNIENLRDLLVQAEEKMVQVGVYITILGESKKDIESKAINMMKILESSLITAKPIIFLQKDAFLTNIPLANDSLKNNYYLNSSTAASFFPFISFDLSDEEGILFGINLQNASFVILDRFSYDNPHMTILARSGSGKSFTAKIEIMRNLMMGNEIIVLDPENEYKSIAEIYDGSFIDISLKSQNKFNPFDLPFVLETENSTDIYKEHVADMIQLCQLLIGEKLSSEKIAILDQAINQTYLSFNILPEYDSNKIKEFPTLNDLERILKSITGGDEIAAKFYPHTQGNFSGFVNMPTSVELEKKLTVFGLKDLPEILRPIGMFIVLNYVFNKIRREIKRRVVIIDESWWIMKQEFGAEFLLNSIKRGRKYGLALTTITQDSEDFLKSPYGKPIITNSALIFLMKQSAATIDICEQIFSLSTGEKEFLLKAERGNGLLIAGNKRVPLYVLASSAEQQIIESRPDQILALKKAKEELNK